MLQVVLRDWQIIYSRDADFGPNRETHTNTCLGFVAAFATFLQESSEGLQPGARMAVPEASGFPSLTRIRTTFPSARTTGAR
jgi:hypothetical protein